MIPAWTVSLLALSMSPQQDESWLANWQADRAQAREQLAAGQPDAGRETLLRVLQHVPDHPTELLLLAQSLVATQQLAEAMEVLQQLAARGVVFTCPDAVMEAMKGSEELQFLRARLQANAKPVSSSGVVTTLPHGDLLPECLAWDPQEDCYYIGSVHRRGVFQSYADDDCELLLSADDLPLGGVFSLSLHNQTRRLIICSARSPQMRRSGNAAFAGIQVLDADSGEHLSSHSVDDSAVLGSSVLDSNGTLYATNSTGPHLYRLVPNTPSGPLEPWLEHPLRSAQGLAWVEVDKTLCVADYSTGLWLLHLSESPRWQHLKPPGNTCLIGIDGLHSTTQGLLAIRNGVRPHAILQVRLGPKEFHDNSKIPPPLVIQEVQVMEATHPEWDEPTQGTIVEDRLHYIGNPHWPQFTTNGQPQEDAILRNAQVRRLQR